MSSVQSIRYTLSSNNAGQVFNTSDTIPLMLLGHMTAFALTDLREQYLFSQERLHPYDYLID